MGQADGSVDRIPHSIQRPDITAMGGELASSSPVVSAYIR